MKMIKQIDRVDFLDERFYTEDGENFYPSVTFVLDSYPKGAGFTQWLKDVGEKSSEIVKRAGDSGTLVHNAINQLLLGEQITWDDKVFGFDEWTYILKFVDFWKTWTPELIGTEVICLSTTLGFAGTIDLVCKIQDQIWLIDLKTSNQVYDSYDLQKAAYTALWNEEHPDLKIQRSGILWFKATTRGPDKAKKNIQGEGWKIMESKYSFEQNFELFQALFKIWKRENPNAKPKNKTYPVTIKL